MSEKITPTTHDIVKVNQKRVVCDGPEFSKHPRVYLTIDGDEVVCPYCGRIYQLITKEVE